MRFRFLWQLIAGFLLVMLVTAIPILGAWWLTRDGEDVAGSGK